jgi:hypothetical protein
MTNVALMTEAELEFLIPPEHSDWLIVRTARQEWPCACADEVTGYEVRVTRPAGTSTQYAPTPERAEIRSSQLAARNPGATVTTVPMMNRRYRADCLKVIPAGTAYLEYLAESASYETGERYCQRCGLAVWIEGPGAR